MNHLQKLQLVHELGQGESPSLVDGLDVFSLLSVDVDALECFEFSLLFCSDLVFLEEGLGNSGLGVVNQNLVIEQLLDHEVHTLIKGQLVGLNVKVWVLGSLVWVSDSSEVLDLTSSCLLVETLNISIFAHLKRSTNEAFVEGNVVFLMDFLGVVSVLGVGRDESDEADLAGEGEKLGHLRDSSNVLCSVLSSEAKVLVETSTDDISIEDEALVFVSEELVKLCFECNGEG